MKISIGIAILILAIGSTLGWQDHQRLTKVRLLHDQTVAEAARSGIALNADGGSKDKVRITKHERGDKEADARAAASEFIAFARVMEEMEKKGGQPDAEMQKKILAIMDRMMGLDAGQLKILIDTVRNTPDLKDDTRRNLIGFSIMSLAGDHPKAALALFAESTDILNDHGISRHVISTSLAKLAQEDPNAALDWVRENGPKFPELVDDDAKRGLISGAAARDPKLAFSLIAELDLKDSGQTVRSIAAAAKTPEERTATLAALREHLKTLDSGGQESVSSNAISTLAQGAAKDGFEAGTKWLDSANLSDAELQSAFRGGMTNQIRSEDTGKWVEWISDSMPADKAGASIQPMVGSWARNDYKAAGEWLSTQPASEMRDSSVKAYAEQVSRYEPQAAVEWALTLPEGRQRQDTFNHIYQNWPKDDPGSKQAAEIFAERHGLK